MKWVLIVIETHNITLKINVFEKPFVPGGGMRGELCEEVLHPVRQDIINALYTRYTYVI